MPRPRLSRKNYATVIVVGCSEQSHILSREELSVVSDELKKLTPLGAPLLLSKVPKRVTLPEGRTAYLKAMHVTPGELTVAVKTPGDLHEGQIERIITCLQLAIYSGGDNIALVPEHLGIELSRTQ